MKRFSKIVFFSLAVFYAFLFVDCASDHEADESTLMKKERNYTEVVQYLMEKHNTSLFVDSSATFSSEFQTELLAGDCVVLDSVVRSVKRIGESYCLNIEVACDDSLKVYAQLVCSEEMIKRYKAINHNSLLIAARIHRIDKIIDDYISEGEPLDPVHIQGERIVLSGRCDDLQKKPTIYDFNEERSGI